MNNKKDRRRSMSVGDKGWNSMLYKMLYGDPEFKDIVKGELRCVGVINLEDEFTQVESLVIRELPGLSAQYAKGLSIGAFKFIKGNRFPLTNTELVNATKDMSKKDKNNFFKNVLQNEPTIPYMGVSTFISDIESLIILENVGSDVVEAVKERLPSHFRDKIMDYFDTDYTFSSLYEERRSYLQLVNDVYYNKIANIVSKVILEDRVVVIDANTINVKIFAGCSWWSLIHNICKDK